MVLSVCFSIMSLYLKQCIFLSVIASQLSQFCTQYLYYSVMCLPTERMKYFNMYIESNCK